MSRLNLKALLILSIPAALVFACSLGTKNANTSTPPRSNEVKPSSSSSGDDAEGAVKKNGDDVPNSDASTASDENSTAKCDSYKFDPPAPSLPPIEPINNPTTPPPDERAFILTIDDIFNLESAPVARSDSDREENRTISKIYFRDGTLLRKDVVNYAAGTLYSYSYSFNDNSSVTFGPSMVISRVGSKGVTFKEPLPAKYLAIVRSETAIYYDQFEEALDKKYGIDDSYGLVSFLYRLTTQKPCPVTLTQEGTTLSFKAQCKLDAFDYVVTPSKIGQIYNLSVAIEELRSKGLISMCSAVRDHTIDALDKVLKWNDFEGTRKEIEAVSQKLGYKYVWSSDLMKFFSMLHYVKTGLVDLSKGKIFEVSGIAGRNVQFRKTAYGKSFGFKFDSPFDDNTYVDISTIHVIYEIARQYALVSDQDLNTLKQYIEPILSKQSDGFIDQMHQRLSTYVVSEELAAEVISKLDMFYLYSHQLKYEIEVKQRRTNIAVAPSQDPDGSNYESGHLIYTGTDSYVEEYHGDKTWRVLDGIRSVAAFNAIVSELKRMGLEP